MPDIPFILEEEQQQALPDEEEKIIQPSKEPTTAPAPIPAPSPYEDAPLITPSHQDHYSFQVGAYQNGQNALIEANKLLAHLQAKVLVVVIPNTIGPNKVLVGDFSTRKATAAYGKSHGLTGFVRKVR